MPAVVPLREPVTPPPDDAITEEATDVTVVCRDGRRLHRFVAHAIGSLERPMSDADLERKFHALVGPVLGAERAAQLVALCASLGRAASVAALTTAARP